MSNVTTTIEKQKRVADFVLDKVEHFDHSCILAGGAVRDWYFAKPASDLDIFFHYRTSTNLNGMYKLLEKSFGEDIKFSLRSGILDEMSDSEYKKNKNLHRVFETQIDGIKIQLMQMVKPTWECVVDEFPLTICKAWYKNGEARYEPEFIKADAHKAIIKTNELYANGDKYVKKIVDKFPDFKYYSSYEQFFRSR